MANNLIIYYSRKGENYWNAARSEAQVAAWAKRQV